MNVKRQLALTFIVLSLASCGGGSPSPSVVSPPVTTAPAGESYMPGNLPPGKVSSPEIIASNVAQVAVARKGNKTLISWYSVENNANANELTHWAASRLASTSGSAIKLGVVDTSTMVFGQPSHSTLSLRDIPIILGNDNVFVGVHIIQDILGSHYPSIGGITIVEGKAGISSTYVVNKNKNWGVTPAEIKKARNSDDLFATSVDYATRFTRHVLLSVRPLTSVGWAESTDIPFISDLRGAPIGDVAISPDGKSITSVYFSTYQDPSLPLTAKPRESGWVVDGIVDATGKVSWGTPNEMLPATTYSAVGDRDRHILDESGATIIVDHLSDSKLLVIAPATIYASNDSPNVKYLVSWLRGGDGSWATKTIATMQSVSTDVHVLKLAPDANGGAVLWWTDTAGFFDYIDWFSNKVSFYQNAEWSAPLTLSQNQRVISDDDGHIVLLSGEDYAIQAQKVTVAADKSIKLGGKTRIVNGAILNEKDPKAIYYLYSGAMDQGHVSVAWITDPRRVDNGFGVAPQAGKLILAEFDYSDLQD